MGIFNIFRRRKNYEYDCDEEYEECEECDEEEKLKEKFNSSIDYKEEVILKDEGAIADELAEIKLQEIELSKEEIADLISFEILKVIEVYGDFNEVKLASREAAIKIGEKYLNELPNYLSGKIHKPSRFIDKYDEIGEWSIVVENSVLMIIYNYKESAVPILKRISQSNSNLNLKATNLLCKLASENIRTNEIVNSIMNNLIAFNDENKIIILGFMSQIKENNQVVGLIQHFYKSFVKNGEIYNAYKTLKHLINAAERFTNGHLKFLKFIAMGKDVINLEEIMTIEEEDPKTVSMESVDESLKVDAAITYYSLNSNDADINSKLYYLSEYSLDKELRKKIKNLLNN